MPSSVSVSGKPQYNLTTPLSLSQNVLAGSTATVRFAGGVNGAIPASGTYAVGDTVVDITGKIYICTTAGAPGTAVWATIGVGAGLTTNNTWTGTNTFNSANGLVVQQGGIAVTGASSFAGALTVSSGGIIVTGNSTITGTLDGITTLTATTFSGALSGNASTATSLQTSRTIQGISFNGTANITVITAGTGVAVSGTSVSIGQAVGTASDVTFNSISTTAGVTIGGDLVVNGTTTSVNSTISTLKDPIISLGGGDAGAAPTVSDAKDRGIEFQWFSSSAAKKGFFGFRQSNQRLIFIPDGTNTAEAFSGTLGDIEATTFHGALSGNASTATSAATLTTSRNINGVAFNGSADITVTAAATTLTGTTLNSAVTASSLTSVGTLTNLTVTNAISGSITGNAGTATTLQTSRDINGVAFNGSADITVTAAAATLTGATLNSAVTASSLTSVGTLTNLTVTNAISGSITGNASTATTLQTSRSINSVAFNGSADITVTAAAATLTGATLNAAVTASSLTSVGTLTNLTVTNAISGSITGNAGTATTLQTSRNINGVAFDGSADITVTAAAATLTGTTLNSAVTASSLTSVGTLTALTVSDTGTTRVSGLTVLQSITAPNDTTHVTSLTAAHASVTNIDIAIIPKGTGALLASVPDSVTTATATGGGKRGSSSVDLQQVRSIGTQGGNTQVASGNYSVISGGAYNAASASYATIPGGYGAKAAIYGKFAYASGSLSSFGDAQFGMYVLRGTTADQSTVVILTTDGTGASASNQCVVSSGQVCGYTINLIANGALSGVYGKSAAQWVLEGLVRRDGAANTTTLIGYPNVSTISDTTSNASGAPDLTNCTVTVQSDTTNGALQIAVQGPADLIAVKWVAIVQMTEVG